MKIYKRIDKNNLNLKNLNNYLNNKKTYLLILLNILLIIFIVLEVSILYNLNDGFKSVKSEKMRDICVGDLC
ncbi:MAG: hypothetical protein CL764_04955 [Chloroflexi bacterium]|nr:hypothetical protein [Chloroflexota bacterium]